MMERRSAIRASGVVSIFGAADPALDEVGLSAWIAQAAPGEALVYHRGFLAVDATGAVSNLRHEFRPSGAENVRSQTHPLRHPHMNKSV